jgi:hypothetical protein
MLNQGGRRCGAALLGLILPAFALLAADTNAPPATVPAALTPEQMFEGGTNSFNNWIDLSAGGFISGGNKAQFQQRHQTYGGAFGGIEDFHYQTDLAKGTTLTTDGRAIFDNDDYKLSLSLTREKLGYVRFSYTEYRTWENGDGGFFPPTGTYYPLSNSAESLKHGDLSVEAGLTLDNLPKVTFKYEHTFREGDQSSTSWGFAQPALNVTRGLSPSFYDINEHSDIFQLDVTHQIKATEAGLGLRYETGRIDDALNTYQYPGQPFAQELTDRQITTYDAFDVHAFTETWLRKNLMLSSGFAYSDLDNNFSGSYISGSAFDVSAPIPNPQAAGTGYYGLQGGSHLQEYVMNLNLLYKPTEHLSITPSVRVQQEDTDASASGIEYVSTPQLGALPPTVFTAPFTANSDQNFLEVHSRLDVAYKGFTNWVLYARGDWTDGQGNLSAAGGPGLVPFFGTGISLGTQQPILQETDENYLYQKYSVGARWYPVRGVTLDAGGYYKLNQYNYNNGVDSTLNPDLYQAYLVMQNFETYDGNLRLTLRPRRNVTLISRYEYQYSTINTTPDPVLGLSGEQTSTMTSHIIAQDVSWTPWSRLYLQVGFNYVLSQTKTPASDVTQAILAAQNNYWTLNFSSGLVLDNKTDLKLGFFYYRADDYTDISAAGVPYGAGGEEYGVTATLTRRISEHLRLSLKYGFSRCTDALYGGNQDFCSQLVYSSLQYRF